MQSKLLLLLIITADELSGPDKRVPVLDSDIHLPVHAALAVHSSGDNSFLVLQQDDIQDRASAVAKNKGKHKSHLHSRLSGNFFGYKNWRNIFI